MEAARLELDLRNLNDEQRLLNKVNLAKHLLQHNVDKKKIRRLLNFIKYYIPFEVNDYLLKFEKNIQQFTKSREAMGIEEAILKEVEEKGHAKGLTEGHAEGVDEKERIVIINAWKKGISIPEIAELVEVSIQKVEAVIELLNEDDKDIDPNSES